MLCSKTRIILTKATMFYTKARITFTKTRMIQTRVGIFWAYSAICVPNLPVTSTDTQQI
jgi:hypothetical protein